MPETRPARPPIPLAALLAVVVALAFAVPARAAVEEPYVPGEAPVTTTWYAGLSAPAQAADRAYVAGMRLHHAGALTMSADYLAAPGRSSPLLQALSRAIVVNQRFEIGVLDAVGRNLAAPPLRLPFGVSLQPVATEGLTGVQRFFREPIPSAAGHAMGPVSAEDVRFAKAMILHHEGAVEMARGYLADARARNGFLGLMNVDILTDQAQEIALMRRVIGAYPGDAAAVVVDPSMIHGMEGMAHAGHAGHGAAPIPVVAPTPAAGPAPATAAPAPAPPARARPTARPVAAGPSGSDRHHGAHHH